MRRFTIHPDDRFGSGEADEQPSTVFQFVLVSVECVDIGYFKPCYLFRGRLLYTLFYRFVFVGRQAGVYAFVVMRSDFFEQQIDEFRGLAIKTNHHVEKVQSSQDAVAFGDVTPKGVSAGFLSANERIHFEHLGRHIFEAYTRFVHGYVVDLPELVQHRRCR